jgi:beta-glucanase (GH16 family)
MNNTVKRKVLYTAMLVAMSQPALSTVDYNLPSDEWRMISLPSDPGSQNTVKNIFGDDISAEYSKDWILYSYNAQDNQYETKGLYDRLKPGEGYWIFQKTGHAVQLDMPANSKAASTTVPLVSSRSQDTQWNLIGIPLTVPTPISELNVKATSGDCANDGCDLDTAKGNKILHNKLWRSSREGSGQFEEISSSDTLNPWDAFWCATLEDAFSMGPVNLKVNATPAPYHIPGKWAVTFHDEFNGSALNPDKWRMGSHHMEIEGKAGNSPEQIKVDNGKLMLTGEKADSDFKFSGKKYTYKTGEISTFKKFHQTYGYYEARIKYDHVPGVWPAFWTMPDRGILCKIDKDKQCKDATSIYGYGGRNYERREGYIKFNLEHLNHRIDSALLKLKVKDLIDPSTETKRSKVFNLSVHKLLSKNWNEGSITWKNKPKYDPHWIKQFNNSDQYTGDMIVGKDIVIDVTSYINEQIDADNKSAGFALVDTFMKAKKIVLGSKESSNPNDRPRLIINGESQPLSPSHDAYVQDVKGSDSKHMDKPNIDKLIISNPFQNTSRTYDGGMEIDIMETLGRWDKDEIQHNLHWDGYSKGVSTEKQGEKHKQAGPDSHLSLSPTKDGYHIYGMHWSKERIVFYIDGKQTWEYEGDFYTEKEKDTEKDTGKEIYHSTGGRIPTVASYILLSHQLGGWSNSGNKVLDNFSPATMSVDYVRVWEKEGAK